MSSPFLLDKLYENRGRRHNVNDMGVRLTYFFSWRSWGRKVQVLKAASVVIQVFHHSWLWNLIIPSFICFSFHELVINMSVLRLAIKLQETSVSGTSAAGLKSRRILKYNGMKKLSGQYLNSRWWMKDAGTLCLSVQRWKKRIMIATLTILSECSAEKNAASYAVWMNEKRRSRECRFLEWKIKW